MNLTQDYTVIGEYTINGDNNKLEEQIKDCFSKFCWKSPPMSNFESKTLYGSLNEIELFWRENFTDNLCFYEGNVERFALYGFGEAWLETDCAASNFLRGKKVAALIIGASLNRGFWEARHSLNCLQETFRRLKENYKMDVVCWNINRSNRRMAFERFLNRHVGSKRVGSVYYV